MCVHFMKIMTVYTLNSHLLTLKAHIEKRLYVFVIFLMKYFWSLFVKQCRSRSDRRAQGYRLTVFRWEQAGPLKQNNWGPSPKLRGPRFGGKWNSFQYHCRIAKRLLYSYLKSETLKICIPLTILTVFGISWMKICISGIQIFIQLIPNTVNMVNNYHVQQIVSDLMTHHRSYLYILLFSGASWAPKHLVLGAQPKI